jgi:hypothetical protein
MSTQEIVAATDKLKKQWMHGLLTDEDYFTALVRLVVIASKK